MAKRKTTKKYKDGLAWYNTQVKTCARGFESNKPIKKCLPLPDDPDERRAIFMDHSIENMVTYKLTEYVYNRNTRELWLVPEGYEVEQPDEPELDDRYKMDSPLRAT